MPPGSRVVADAWVARYEEAKQTAADILELVQERNVKYPAGGQDASRVTALARRKLGALGSSIEALQDLLDSPESSMERNVRRDMIATLRSGREQMLQAVRRDGRSQGRPGAGEGGPSGPARETVRTAELDNPGLVQLQRQVMQEQDSELAELERTVNSTKHIALTINEELGLQERLLEELDEDVEVSHSRLRAAQKKLAVVMRQSGHCKTTLVAIALMAVLAVVIVVCFKLARLLF